MNKGHYSLINTLYSVMYAKTKIYILGKTCIFLIKLIAANFKGLKSSALKIIKKGHYGSLFIIYLFVFYLWLQFLSKNSPCLGVKVLAYEYNEYITEIFED